MRFWFCGLDSFIGNRYNQQTLSQFDKGFGLMKMFLVLLCQFRGQGCKIFLSQPNHQKSSGNSIVHLPMFITQGTI